MEASPERQGLPEIVGQPKRAHQRSPKLRPAADYLPDEQEEGRAVVVRLGEDQAAIQRVAGEDGAIGKGDLPLG